MRHRNNRNKDEETTYWLSYSDMMAGLLLTFVLIISFTVLHSKIQYDQKQEELAGKENQLLIQSEELENKMILIDEQSNQLAEQEALLSDQQAEMLVQQQQLDDQQKKLSEQEAMLVAQSELLTQLKDLMESQQAKLDSIIGIRSELIEALKKEFSDSSLKISVDEKSGAIAMDSSILFPTNQFKLKESGEEFLKDFMPRYQKILLSPKYKEYIAEIVIEGHTDQEGDYLFNLDLSQKRAYSVAAYCVDSKNKVLSEKEIESLQQVLSTDGKSFSDPILNEDGSVNDEASRRVEIKFRLRDEEMIREMVEIMNSSSD